MTRTTQVALLAVGIVVGLLLGVTAFKPTPVEVDNTPHPGSVVGPESYYDAYNNNGVYTYMRTSALIAATTTPCDLKGPSSTSTLEAFSMNITTGTSTTGLLTLGTSTLPNATTSLVTQKSVAAGTLATFTWHPGVDNAVVAPNGHVVVGVAGLTYGYTYGGTCNATFRGVNLNN